MPGVYLTNNAALEDLMNAESHAHKSTWRMNHGDIDVIAGTLTRDGGQLAPLR